MLLATFTPILTPAGSSSAQDGVLAQNMGRALPCRRLMLAHLAAVHVSASPPQYPEYMLVGLYVSWTPSGFLEAPQLSASHN